MESQQQQHLNHNTMSPIANRSGEKSHRGNGLTPAEFLSDDDNSEHNIDNMGYTQEQTRSMNQQLAQLNPGLSFQQMQGHLQDQEQVSVIRCIQYRAMNGASVISDAEIFNKQQQQQQQQRKANATVN